MSEDIERKIRALRALVHHHNFRYHVLDDPEISDSEYDARYRELESLEEKHPEYTSPDSPTQKVGDTWRPEDFVADALPSVRHRRPMLSLDNVKTGEELEEWLERARKHLPEGTEIPLTVEYKLDGEGNLAVPGKPRC